MINAIKNYFIKLWEILFSAIKFGTQNIKSMFSIWGLILVQFILGIPLLYLSGTISFSSTKPLMIVAIFVALILYLITLFFMFKKVFKIASKILEKDEISNARIVKSLLFLGLFNCIPALFVSICMLIVSFFEQSANIAQIASIVFTYLFYISMSLSIVSIVYWQDKKIVCAILNSLKAFFATIKHSMIIFILIFALASLVSFLICTILYAIAIYFKVLDNSLLEAVHGVVNIYCLYVFATFYIGAQAKIIKEYNTQNVVKEEEQENNEQF